MPLFSTFLFLRSMLFIKMVYKNLSALLFFGIVWIIFSQIFDKFLVSCGIFSLFLCLLILNYLKVLPNITISLKGITYILRVLYDILIASIKLSKIIWSDRITIEPCVGIVNFDNLSNPVLTTMRANAITLTPGTIVIGINKNQMLVHFADKNDYSEQPSNVIEKILS